MKTKLTLTLIKRAALLVLLSSINPQRSTFAQGTAFTYQGRLSSGEARAAIQGLNQKLEQKETEIAELKQRLEALERIIHHQKSN